MNAQKWIISVAVCAVIIAGAGICAAEDTITIKGSATMKPLAQALADEFVKTNAAVTVSVSDEGATTAGIAALVEGTCDIANSTRSLKESEIAAATEKGKTLKKFTIAVDGLAIIVNAANSIDALTKQQVKDIFTGKTTNWSDLGGNDQAITVVSREKGTGTYDSFSELALNKEDVASSAAFQANDKASAETVAGNPGAIAFLPFGYLNDTVKAASIQGSACTKDTIAAYSYPYTRELMMYTNSEQTSTIKAFIDFVKSEQGKVVIESKNFIPIS